MPFKAWLTMASLLGALAVALGAFGAHGMPRYLGIETAGPKEQALLKRRLENFETAARYHMYHALALLAVAWVAAQIESEPSREQSAASFLACQAAGWLFVVGILIFSGCLYAQAITGQNWLGMIVPIGGAALILGWFSLAYAAMQWKSPQP